MRTLRFYALRIRNAEVGECTERSGFQQQYYLLDTDSGTVFLSKWMQAADVKEKVVVVENVKCGVAFWFAGCIYGCDVTIWRKGSKERNVLEKGNLRNEDVRTYLLLLISYY